MEKANLPAPSSAKINPAADLEKQRQAQAKDPKLDPNLVVWDALNDPENPFGWTRGKKIFVSSIIIFIQFVVNTGTSIFSPSN